MEAVDREKLIQNNFDEAVELLTSKSKFYIELGLDRIGKMLELYGNPQDGMQYIHVAGTNGKGSVCAMLASILKERYSRVGLYTSPHIFDYTERIKVNGVDIPKSVFADYVLDICDKSEKNKIYLTEFEILTVTMFLYFKELQVDIVVLETGLGGRCDATNVIKENICSIITHIDLDHTERLGSTRDEIAYEKAGIIKQNCPVITACGLEVIHDVADEKESMFILINPVANPLFKSACPLKGAHQDENIALAVTAIKEFFKEFTDEDILFGLKNVQHPYRCEFFQERNLLVDVCHNPNGAVALRAYLDEQFKNKPRRFIFGCLNNKGYRLMMEALFRPEDEIMFYEFDYPKAAAFIDLKDNCDYTASRFNGNLALDEKLTVICGSFYMLNQIRGLKQSTHPDA